jgi:hypothetical protein
MDKKIAGLLGAAAALVTVGAANAAGLEGTPSEPGLTYRELLNPVQNAVETLKADDARRDSAPPEATQVAQVTIGVGHHHHHHHARAQVRIVPPHRRDHHHHHHHHHHSNYYGR